MSIPQTLIPQKDFSAGELSPDAERRDDLEIMRAGARNFHDWQWLPTSGFKRRDGAAVKYSSGARMLRAQPAADTIFDLEFRSGEVRFYDGASPASVQTITGCPWTAAQLYDLSIVAFLKYVMVAHHGFIPQILEYDEAAGTWARRDFAFYLDPAGKRRQPFYRFAVPGIKIDSTSDTGVVTITASAAVFAPGHVGTIFRYVDRQFRVTAYNSPTNVTALCLEQLHQSFDITVTSNRGFEINDVVEGATGGTTGIVTRKTGTTHVFMVITNSFDDPFTAGEILVGPTGRSAISGDVAVTPESISVWDEAFMSAYRGYPGGVAWDRRRVIFYDFAQLPGAVIESAIDSIDDFKVGTDADDAIFEIAPDDVAIVGVVGGPDQFVLTNKGIYYMPISADNPLAPGRIEFREIAQGGASRARPAKTNQGILYLSDDKSRLMAIVPTGQTAQPYQIAHVSRYHNHLIDNAIEVAASPGDENSPGDFIYVVNADGSVVFGRYDPDKNWVGLQPWNIQGTVKSVAARLSTVLFAIATPEMLLVNDGEFLVLNDDEATIIDDTVLFERTLEMMDGAMLDVEHVLYSDDGHEVLLGNDGEPLLGNDNEPLVTGDYELAGFVGEGLSFIRNDSYAGTQVVGALGALSATTAEVVELRAGYNFRPKITPFTPNFAGGENFKQRTRKRKIARLVATARESQGFIVKWPNGLERRVAAYNAGEDQSRPPPKRDRTYHFRSLGRDHDPEIAIENDLPGSLKIVEIAMELTS